MGLTRVLKQVVTVISEHSSGLREAVPQRQPSIDPKDGRRDVVSVVGSKEHCRLANLFG